MTSSPTSTPVPCTDSPLGWYDIDGDEFDCEYYAVGNHCEDYGDNYENDGATANQACCVCGGGKDPSNSSPVSTPSPSFSPVVKPSSSPVAKPSSSPVAEPFTSSPTSTPASCTDSPPGWYDSDGPNYNCEFYAGVNNCEDFGDNYESDGATANQACCVCGGGKDPSNSSPDSTPSPSSSPVVNPTGEDLCQDNDKNFQYTATTKQNCKFIGNENTEQRCDKYNGIGNENCPVTCKTGCTCYDTEGEIFLWGGITKTCNWAANNTEKRCKRNAIRANCPIVCGLC